MTAGGAVCAMSLGMKVKAVEVGWTSLAASSVAKRAILDREPVGDEVHIIAFGQSLGLFLAAGVPIPEQPNSDTIPDAPPLYGWAASALTAFGAARFTGLVEALEAMRRIGVYPIDGR